MRLLYWTIDWLLSEEWLGQSVKNVSVRYEMQGKYLRVTHALNSCRNSTFNFYAKERQKEFERINLCLKSIGCLFLGHSKMLSLMIASLLAIVTLTNCINKYTNINLMRLEIDHAYFAIVFCTVVHQGKFRIICIFCACMKQREQGKSLSFARIYLQHLPCNYRSSETRA